MLARRCQRCTACAVVLVRRASGTRDVAGRRAELWEIALHLMRRVVAVLDFVHGS